MVRHNVTIRKRRRGREVREALSNEKKKLIASTVENLKQLDEMSLRIIQGSCEVLKVRDAMDKTEEEKKTG